MHSDSIIVQPQQNPRTGVFRWCKKEHASIKRITAVPRNQEQHKTGKGQIVPWLRAFIISWFEITLVRASHLKNYKLYWSTHAVQAPLEHPRNRTTSHAKSKKKHNLKVSDKKCPAAPKQTSATNVTSCTCEEASANNNISRTSAISSCQSSSATNTVILQMESGQKSSKFSKVHRRETNWQVIRSQDTRKSIPAVSHPEYGALNMRDNKWIGSVWYLVVHPCKWVTTPLPTGVSLFTSIYHIYHNGFGMLNGVNHQV